jgi:hypothetical protein
VDSRVWAENFARFGPQVIGRTMFDYGYPNWGENPRLVVAAYPTRARALRRLPLRGRW